MSAPLESSLFFRYSLTHNTPQAYLLVRTSKTLKPGGSFLEGATMKMTPKLQQQLKQAVQTSMRIEGYSTKTSPPTQARATELMKQQRVQVSVPSK